MTNMTAAPGASDTLSKWPDEGLERVRECPACGEPGRRVLHAGLTDRVFFCAPGAWDLHQCVRCGCGYLDPRPTAGSIHLAYRTYYTHTPVARVDTSRFGPLGRCRHALANGYRNWRYGTRYEPATRLGVLAAWFAPGRRRAFEDEYRSLPRPAPGARLLDVGCGSGSFLEAARAAGWHVAGVDPDPITVEAARKRGLDVRQGDVGAFADRADSFDVATLSHVIEHLHEPRAVLTQVFRLLKPGGRLWVETPNIDSYGHARFGRHWRGLEPPRHLVLFNWRVLESMLREAGFDRLQRLARHHMCAELAAKSSAIRDGGNPWEPPAPTLADRARGLAMRLASRLNYRRSEYVTLVAFKPPALGQTGCTR